MRFKTLSKPQRVGLMLTFLIVTADFFRISARTIKNAAEEKSAGINILPGVHSFFTGRQVTLRPAIFILALKSFSIRSVWSREWNGSMTVVFLSA